MQLHCLWVEELGFGLAAGVTSCDPSAHLFGELMRVLQIDIKSVLEHHGCMRTTLTLDDDIFQIAKDYAENRSIGLGKAVSELVRRGSSLPMPTCIVNGLHVFDPPPGSPMITRKKVRELQDSEE